jgi:uncharacterized protein YbjQ (UPF0145 family)
MIIGTINSVPKKEIEKSLGVVYGSTVRTRWVGRDIAAGLKTLIGGEIKGYAEMISTAREEAVRRMVKKAKGLGADAIVGMRFSTTTVMGGAAEILAYGTAVKFK